MGTLARIACRTTSEDVLSTICKKVSTEAARMCSDTDKTKLGMSDLASLASFVPKDVIADMEQHAPTLLALLQAVSNFKEEGVCMTKSYGHVAMAATCLLRLCSCRMTAMQYVTGSILYNADAKKRVYTRLSHLGVTVTPESQRMKVSAMTSGYDKPILKWRRSVSASIGIMQWSMLLNMHPL